VYSNQSNLGTDEQAKKYVVGAARQKIYGCYAQTELGHGSNIAVSKSRLVRTIDIGPRDHGNL